MSSSPLLDINNICEVIVPLALSAEVAALHDPDASNDRKESHFWIIESSGRIVRSRSFWCISTRTTIEYAALPPLHLNFNNSSVYLPGSTSSELLAELHHRFAWAVAEYTLFLAGLHPAAQPHVFRDGVLFGAQDDAALLKVWRLEQAQFIGTHKLSFTPNDAQICERDNVAK